MQAAIFILVGLMLATAGCLPDDPIDDNNPFTEDDVSDDDIGDDDDFVPSDPEDCPVWAPEYKVGYYREFYMEDDSDRNATYLGLQEWQGGVYWADEVFSEDLGEVEYRVYDHCMDGNLYRVGLEKTNGDLMLFNPPVLQLEAGVEQGAVWTSEYNLMFRHFTERYEALGLEAIDIGAGSFEALHVAMRLSYIEGEETIEVFWDSWYVEELGLVKQESTSPTYVEMTYYEMPEEWR